MFYSFGTAILVDLLLTTIIFPRIQTLAESLKDFDKKGIAFEGESCKSWQLFDLPLSKHSGLHANSQRMESERRSTKKKGHVDDVIENMCRWRQIFHFLPQLA